MTKKQKAITDALAQAAHECVRCPNCGDKPVLAYDWKKKRWPWKLTHNKAICPGRFCLEADKATVEECVTVWNEHSARNLQWKTGKETTRMKAASMPPLNTDNMKRKIIEGREFTTYNNAHGRSEKGRLMSVTVWEWHKETKREFAWSRASHGNSIHVLVWVDTRQTFNRRGEGYFRAAREEDARRVKEFVSAMVDDMKAPGT